MGTVTSADGTRIEFSATGSGPAVVLVDGAFGHRHFGPNESLAPALTDRFTVHSYDRRGRGGSGDTAPFAPEREYEDLAAVIDAAGGEAFVYGISSGAALVLDAAGHGVPMRKIAVFEAPFVVDASRPPVPADAVPHLQELVAAGERSAAVKYFMTSCVGLPAPFVAFMRLLPAWSKLKAVAHTVPYDVAELGDAGSGHPLDPARWAKVAAPTLVMDGGKSPTWMRTAMPALAAALPDARHRTLPGQMHVVKAAAMAPVLKEFFGS
jgi:pimeloyl-ACP methyl ester carboxylesterase